MSLQDKINNLLKETEGSEPFCSCFSVKCSHNERSLIVEYSSVFGLYDLYDIKECMNQREEKNHVKYKYNNNVLTIMVNKSYSWHIASRSSTDFLRLSSPVKRIQLEYFEYKP